MKKVLFLLLAVAVFASDVENILKNVPKNSPSYSLDLILAKKIKSLTYTQPGIDLNITDTQKALNTFNKIVAFEESYLNIPSKIDEINNKIELLQKNSDPTSKLQKLYYTKLLKIYEKKLLFFQNNIPVFEKRFLKSLKKIQINTQAAKKDISYWKKLLTQKKKEYEKLKIDLQKWQLLNDTKNIQNIQHYVKINLLKQEEIYTQILKNQLIIWFDELKQNNKHAFQTSQIIEKYAKKAKKNLYDAYRQIILDFEKLTFGSKVIVYSAKNEFEILKQNIINTLNYPLFNVNGKVITPLNFAFFIIILILGWFIGKYYKKLIYQIRHKYKISHSTATLLGNMGYYTIIVVSFLFALKSVGLDLSSLAIIAGALSVGIGFGLQNIVSNFVSGIILMFERSIKVGDYIQIDENTRGEVVDISMRSTIIRTNDNINLIIPNQSFIQNNVINWTLGDDIVRFRVPFGVAYGSDVDKVEKTVLEALKKTTLPVIKNHPSLDVSPYVVFMEMADSSLNFELFVWVKGEYARRPRRTRSEFLKMIYNALNDEGISIPFPQQDLHIKDSVPFEIKIDTISSKKRMGN